MHVNNEQTNTQKMLEHNRAKEKACKGSLERKIQNVSSNNIVRTESTALNCQDYTYEKLEGLVCGTGSILSDADAQLIIKLKFSDKVDCHNLYFHRTVSDESMSPPRMVKIFANQASLDFSDVETAIPLLSVELPFEYDEGKPFLVNLSSLGAKFARISSIQIFIEDNFGTDVTSLGPVHIEGSLVPSYHTEFK